MEKSLREISLKNGRLYAKIADLANRTGKLLSVNDKGELVLQDISEPVIFQENKACQAEEL